MIVIAIDAAVRAGNTGVVVGRWDGERVSITDAFTGAGSDLMSEWLPTRLEPWITMAGPGIIAIDSPLGWPRKMRELVGTDAGESLPMGDSRENVFLRRTDRLVRYTTRQLPLAVGADRIARTTAASLELLGALRGISGQRIPLAWTASETEAWRAIEVYPAATLASRRGRHSRPYREERAHFEAFASEHLVGADQLHAVAANEHVLDAAVAAIATQDFLRNDVLHPRPSEVEVARREGWVWCYAPRFCHPCSAPLISAWRGVPVGFGRGRRENTPPLPQLPLMTSSKCQTCGSTHALPMDHIVFVNVHGPHNTGLPDYFVMDIEAPAPGSRHEWLEHVGIPLPYSSASLHA